MAERLSKEERAALARTYEAGTGRLQGAWDKVPDEARKWRPGPGKWSAHEVVCHCADSEANAALRIRYLVVEKDPLIVGYDQAVWAVALDYHSHPVEPALATIAAVRAHTAALLHRLPEEAWSREGRHSESGRYTPEDWLRIYARHLEGHAEQIERNLLAWQAAQARP